MKSKVDPSKLQGGAVEKAKKAALDAPPKAAGSPKAAPKAAAGGDAKKGGDAKAAPAAKAEAKEEAPAKEKKKKEAPAKPAEREIGDVTRLNIKVGKIVKVWEHETAEKLWCEEIDVGEAAPRTIASGLRAHVTKEEMVGSMVCVLANLKSRKMMGFESQGMVLCGTSAAGKVELLQVPAGVQVGERVTFEGTEMGEQGNPIATPREEIQFDVCQENPSLDNLIDDPDTPFDETSVGRYMPGYLKYHCNDDATITIRHYHEPTCMGHEADYGASLQHLMNAVFTQDFDTSLDDMTDDGAVIQFTYPHKFKNGQCYPIMQLDLSNLQGGAKDPINLATKYHFRGCPAPGGGGGDTPGTGGGDTPPPPPAATCDEHMVTVLSAQVTTACCPQFDPNCGIPDTCSPRCAPVFNNFYDSCQSFIDGVELAAFRDKCTAAGGAAGGGGRGGR